MKLFNTILSLFTMAYVAMATSESFFLQSIRSGSAIQNSAIAVDGNDLVINGQQAVGGRISDDGFFWIGFQYVATGPNSEMILVDNKDQATNGWSIQNGFITYSTGFYAVPADGGSYKLFFGTSQDSNSIPFAIRGLSTANDGSTVPDFAPNQPYTASPTGSASTVSTTASATGSNPTPVVQDGDTQPFYFQIIRSGSGLQFAGINIDGSNLVVNGQPGIQGVMTKDGLIRIGDQYLTPGPNSEMSLTDDVSKAATGFSVQNGFIDGASFYGVKTDNGYNLFFGTTQDANNTPFAIKPLANGESAAPIPDFIPGQSGSSSAPASTTSEDSSSSASSTSSVSSTSSSAPVPTTTPQDGDSQVFGFLINRSGSRIQHSSITIGDNNNLAIGQPGINGVVTKDGLVRVGNLYLTANPNSQMTLTDDVSKAFNGFSIQNGYLTYGPGYYAAQLEDGSYSLLFGTTQNANDIPFAITCVGDNGSPVSDFAPGGGNSSASSSSETSSDAPSSSDGPSTSSSDGSSTSSSDGPSTTSSDGPSTTSSQEPATTSSQDPATSSSQAPATTSSQAPATTQTTVVTSSSSTDTHVVHTKNAAIGQVANFGAILIAMGALLL